MAGSYRGKSNVRYWPIADTSIARKAGSYRGKSKGRFWPLADTPIARMAGSYGRAAPRFDRFG